MVLPWTAWRVLPWTAWRVAFGYLYLLSCLSLSFSHGSAACLAWLSTMEFGSLFQRSELILNYLPPSYPLGFVPICWFGRSHVSATHVLASLSFDKRSLSAAG